MSNKIIIQCFTTMQKSMFSYTQSELVVLHNGGLGYMLSNGKRDVHGIAFTTANESISRLLGTQTIHSILVIHNKTLIGMDIPTLFESQELILTSLIISKNEFSTLNHLEGL